MPQQQIKDDFVPDDFEPDIQDDFVPDDFEPDQSKQVSKYGRPDTQILGGLDTVFDSLRELAVNRVSTNPFLPEAVKPYAAMGASLSLEPIRFIVETLNEPETVATGILGTAGGTFNRLRNFLGSKNKVITPEVLPPEQSVIQKLLPEHTETNPLIVGVEGRTQRRSLLNPQEEARLLGHDVGPEGPIGFPSQAETSRFVDLGEVREAERIKNLSYTDRDLQGGTPLIIPNRPALNPPATLTDRLGFDIITPRSGELEYPLNVVPQAVLPRTSQSITEALTPERFAREVVDNPFDLTKAVSSETPKPILEKPARNLLGGTAAIEPGEALLPSAIKKVKREVKENTGLNAPINPKISPDIPAPIANEVKAGTKKFVQESKNPSILFKSIYTQLSELGQSGRELVHRFQRATQKRAEYDAVWTEPLFKVASKLNRGEFDNFGAYVEGTIPIPNERVRLAVDEWNKAQNMMGDAAVSSQLHMKRGKEVIPFEKIENNYWPHIPSENLTKKTIVERLMAEGMTRHDATIVAKRWENTGEIFLRGQHSRLKDKFPYRTDFDVAIHHGRSMSKRIANHQELGPKDVSGRGDEGIANLIEDTSDPNLAYKLARRLAGREELPNERLVKGLNQARKWMSLTSLPNFTIPNVILGQAQNAYMAVVSGHPIKAAKEISRLLNSAYRDEVRASGVFNSFNRTLTEELSGVDPWMIGAGEKINRSVAAAIGRSAVKEAFTDYKAGKNVQSAKYFLETLLARDPDSIQTITPELERFAAGRMAEITQGLNNPGNLPYGWSSPVNSYGSVATQLFLIFKKVGFQVTKTVKDTIKANPKIAIPAWIATTQVAGEMVGDIKSLLTGRERPEELEMRIAENWGNAFMLGLPWELATSSAYGPKGLVASAAGPAFSKASEFAYGVSQATQKIYEDKDDPFGTLRRFGLKNIPLPGRERIKSAIEDED